LVPQNHSTIKAVGFTAQTIARTLRSQGYKAFLVGGCVRDLLLEREPKDFDISTDATPAQVTALFPGAQLVGAHFGVVLVDGVEIATFRSDQAYSDGRHPESVVFETDPRQDVIRRDFTINALMLDPLDPRPAKEGVIDYVGGVNDLKTGVVRAIGDPARRFEEDHLRMLRAVRFASRFRFVIEPATMAAIKKLHAIINRIAAERIRDELIRILTEGGARYGFELLDQSGLLQDILPEISAMKGVEQPPEFHPEGDVWVHTLMMLENMQAPSPALATGVLLHDVGKPPTFRIAERIRFDGHVEAGENMARRIMSRLRFSNEDCEQVLALIGNHMRFKDVPRMRESTIKRFLRLPRFEEHLELHRLDCMASHGHLDHYNYMKQRFQESPPEEIRPPKLLTGRDLIEAGYQPGPIFTKILDAAEDAQLEHRISNRKEALELVETLFPRA
jgi:poly(A) polymerase